MPLIRSISGFRGTIGGSLEEGLTPPEIVRAVSAFSSILKEEKEESSSLVVIGRDARPSGSMVRDLVVGTLQGMGFDVLDLGLSTTPTVEMSVISEKAIGGIVLTASHNPMEWNALKFLNKDGEFISASIGKELVQRAQEGNFSYAPYDGLGTLSEKDGGDAHIKKIVDLPLVDREAIRNEGFKVVVDGIDSTGGIYVPRLLKTLGVEAIVELNCEPTGRFSHDPEPLPEELEGLARTVWDEKADLGIVVDPDVDRLAFIDENGEPFGEEYTLVAVADHVLEHKKGDTVSNLSSSRALRDVTEGYGAVHHASAVGEVNVVQRMKEVNAVIGGEGNGGVILPELHYGRDALVGIALFLTLMAKRGKSCSSLREGYPNYFMAKERASLKEGDDVDALLDRMAADHEAYPQNREDGVKIEFEDEWVHLRRSNTEPIVRIYTESRSQEGAQRLAEAFVDKIQEALEKTRRIEN